MNLPPRAPAERTQRSADAQLLCGAALVQCRGAQGALVNTRSMHWHTHTATTTTQSATQQQQQLSKAAPARRTS